MKSRLLRLVLLGVISVGTVVESACSYEQQAIPRPFAKGSSSDAMKEPRKAAPGEYLVTLAPDAHIRVITDAYRRYGIKRLQALGHNVFLLVLREDPGLAKMKALRPPDARAVQRNLLYKAMQPGRPQQ